MTREELRDYVDFLRSQDEISYDVYSGLIDGIDTLEQEPTPKNDLEVAEMIRIVRESDVIDRTDGSVLAKAFNYLFDKYIENPTPKNNLGVDCISREKALVAIRNLYPSMPRVDFNGSLRKWVDKYKPYIECDDAIKQLPSVTSQEPRKGHWIDINGIYAECSNCNEEIYITGDFKYCPNCGADMREVEE